MLAIKQPGKTISVVWVGLPGNLRYLEPLRDCFRKLTDLYDNFELKIICSEFPEWDDVNLTCVEWTTETEKYEIVNSTIGIMPLDQSEYASGKFAFKLLQYMSAKLPCVANL